MSNRKQSRWVNGQSTTFTLRSPLATSLSRMDWAKARGTEIEKNRKRTQWTYHPFIVLQVGWNMTTDWTKARES